MHKKKSAPRVSRSADSPLSVVAISAVVSKVGETVVVVPHDDVEEHIPPPLVLTSDSIKSADSRRARVMKPNDSARAIVPASQNRVHLGFSFVG